MELMEASTEPMDMKAASACQSTGAAVRLLVDGAWRCQTCVLIHTALPVRAREALRPRLVTDRYGVWAG